MNVAWRPTTITDRMDMLDAAELRAYEKRDPQVFIAALVKDQRVEDEGSQLDGVATWPDLHGLPGTGVYTGCGGQWVILYRRAPQGACTGVTASRNRQAPIRSPTGMIS